MFIGITQELQASKKHWMDERGCREIQSKVIIEPREAKNSSAGKKITQKKIIWQLAWLAGFFFAR
jgi:hypothetical protein